MDESEKRKIKILLADDHAVVRAGIRQFLETGADLEVVVEAMNGKEVCDLIPRHEIDVAVLDIQMPEMSGIEVTRWLAEHHPEVRVLILTSYDDDPYVMATLNAGATGYVLKTARPNEIVKAVRQVASGQHVFDPAVAYRVLTQAGRQADASGEESLTERELEVLSLAALGKTNKLIGAELEISDRTVQGHLARIFAKLGANSRTEAVTTALRLGLIQLDEK